jgi:heme-degrading monooxygenase HmoA
VVNHVTLINPFEVPAGKEDEFMERWKQAGEYFRQREGFVSTRLHQSLDPEAAYRFINVGVWESSEHFRQATSTPEFQELLRGFPFSSHPALYRLISE